MARTQGVSIENNFVQGLITENTALTFPPNACTEAINCVFNETGRIVRRKEFDIEANASFSIEVPNSITYAYTEFAWVNAGGTGLVNIHVVQDGATLRFYNVSNTTTVSANPLSGTVNLTSYKAASTTYDPKTEPCQFTIGNGDLIVVNRACDPLYVSIDINTMAITATKITIQYRDFLGLETGYADNFRPTFDMGSLKTNPVGVLHFYNLLNQGWWNGAIAAGSPDANSALGQWDTARTDMPSNSDYLGFFRASPTDPFDPARVDVNNQGTGLAPKGHFILSLGEADRRGALVAAGYTLSFDSVNGVGISGATGTNISANLNGGSVVANAFDASTTSIVQHRITTTTTTSNQVLTPNFFVGKNYGGSPKKIFKAVLTPRNNTAPFALSFKTSAPIVYYNINVTYELRGHSSAPATRTEGTLLATSAFVYSGPGLVAPLTLVSTDTTTPYQYVWIRMTASTIIPSPTPINTTIQLGEVDFFEAVTTTGTGVIPSTDVTAERPTTCAFYAGRAWYAGIDAKNIGSNLYFSQIIEREKQYGKCFQVNDPTSEDVFELLPSDGGVIRIPEIGKIIKLYTQQSSLLVFATNGIWVVSGSSQGAGFSANNFNVKRISSLGTQSPFSFIDVKGLPMWWGEDGIFRMDYNPQFDSFSVISESQEKIQRYFLAIDPYNRAKVKGAYDSANDIAYFLVRNQPVPSTPFRYDTVLCFNTRSKAFYPLTFSTSTTPTIVGVSFVQDSVGFSKSSIKYTTINLINAFTKRITFSDSNKEIPEYRDWYDFARSEYGVPEDEKYFLSTFTTGYKLDGETQRFFQGNYVFVFLEALDNSGAIIEGLWDYGTSEASNRWTGTQSLYNTAVTNRSINYRRLKIRGKGRALQIRISNDGNKGFTIIGWSAWETVNAKL